MNNFKHPPWFAFVPVLLALAAGTWLFNRYYLADQLVFARVRNEALLQDLQSSIARTEAQRSRAIIAEREVDIMRNANNLLRESERRHQDEIAALEADLSFYRRLGGASGSQAALAIHHMELQPTRSPRVYRAILTLTQNIRWAAAISGQVGLSLEGIQNGAARHIDEEQLLAESVESMNFQFKYFQQLERLITLPEGFEPVRLTVRLQSRSLRSVVEQSTDWDQLFEQTSSESSGSASRGYFNDD